VAVYFIRSVDTYHNRWINWWRCILDKSVKIIHNQNILTSCDPNGCTKINYPKKDCLSSKGGSYCTGLYWTDLWGGNYVYDGTRVGSTTDPAKDCETLPEAVKNSIAVLVGGCFVLFIAVIMTVCVVYFIRDWPDTMTSFL
jgi:hypothetical protein